MSKLYEEISEQIVGVDKKRLSTTKASKAIEKIAIRAQIEENNLILVRAKVYMDARAVMVLSNRIHDLTKQLES